MEIKCPNCRKSTNVYPSKLDGHYVCIACCCIFTQKKKEKKNNDIKRGNSDGSN